MLKIGITGGIGSGKSTVSQIFRLLGIPVYHADEEAKKLMNDSLELRQKITAIFGEESYTSAGLNRPFLAAKVFNNEDQLKKLNSLVHPIVIKQGEQWLNAQKAPYVLKEAAIFFESGSAEGLDYIIGVYAPLAIRIQRVMQRDGITPAEIRKRMDQQIDEELKMKLCDFVVTNNEQQLVIPQVMALHQLFLEKSTVESS